MELDAIDRRSAALLIVDMQNAFVHQNGALGIPGADTERLPAGVPAMKRLIDRFAMADIP
jgi:ureidoacrylate peracid hydrolase